MVLFGVSCGAGNVVGDKTATLKTREERPSPIVAMRPPNTDVALSPILIQGDENKII